MRREIKLVSLDHDIEDVVQTGNLLVVGARFSTETYEAVAHFIAELERDAPSGFYPAEVWCHSANPAAISKYRGILGRGVIPVYEKYYPDDFEMEIEELMEPA